MLPSEELWNILEKRNNAKTPEEFAYWEGKHKEYLKENPFNEDPNYMQF